MENTCGLSSFLMCIMPDVNLEFKLFLDELFDNIEFHIPNLFDEIESLNEYKWSVALEYILLKCLGSNILSPLIEKKLARFYENYKILTNFKLQDREHEDLFFMPDYILDHYFDFFDSFLVNPYILNRSLFSMKTDKDIRMLFTLFGGKFHPHESPDGTGALFFTESDFKSTTSGDKLKLLNDHLNNLNEEKVPCILLNLEQHWVTVNTIQGNSVYFNDPYTGELDMVEINQNFLEGNRFYLYYLKPESAIILRPDIKRFLLTEASREFKNVQKFTESVKDKIQTDMAVDLSSEGIEHLKDDIQKAAELSFETKKEDIDALTKILIPKEIISEIADEFHDIEEVKAIERVEIEAERVEKIVEKVKVAIEPITSITEEEGIPRKPLIEPLEERVVKSIKKVKDISDISEVKEIEEIAFEVPEDEKMSDIHNFAQNLLRNFEFQKQIVMSKADKSKVKDTIVKEEIKKPEPEKKEEVYNQLSDKQKTEVLEKKKDVKVTDIHNFTINLLKRFDAKKKLLDVED